VSWLPGFPGRAVATVLGAGYCPVAPGTAGSIVSALVFLLLSPGTVLGWVIAVAVLPLGYWGCREGMRNWGSDPSRVVVDEFAGCWIACLGAPAEWGIAGIGAAFLLFRTFDILKPWPVSVFDRMDSAAGILLDDIVAGLMASALLLMAASVHGHL